MRTISSKSDHYKPSPFENEAGKSTVSREAPPLRLNVLPSKGSGVEIPTGKELFDMMKNPKMQEAVTIVEKVYGCETGIRRAIRKQIVKDRIADMHLEVNKRVIDLAVSKWEE